MAAHAGAARRAKAETAMNESKLKSTKSYAHIQKKHTKTLPYLIYSTKTIKCIDRGPGASHCEAYL